jgi:hypothetical protein
MSKRGFMVRLLFLALIGLAAAPATAYAAAAPGGNSAALTAERGRLRGELDRVSAEIDALKRTSRGVGDDYRLRARQADAEALARRLIEIEARLGLRPPAARPAPLPIAEPTDGPADLDAKADILADQSRRVRGEADALGRRVAEIKGRQELRRRAADLERDPFAPLEGSKRRVASIAAGGPLGPVASNGDGKALAGSPTPTLTPPPLSSGASGGGASPTTSGPTQTAGVPVSATVGSPATTPPTPIASPTATTATGPNTPAATLSVELRDLLDPATVADIRRLEGTKTPTGSVQAIERAVAALRARADSLDAEARAMRASARATP